MFKARFGGLMWVKYFNYQERILFCFALPVAVSQACNFSACIWETETGRSQVQSQHGFSILRSCLSFQYTQPSSPTLNPNKQHSSPCLSEQHRMAPWVKVLVPQALDPLETTLRWKKSSDLHAHSVVCLCSHIPNNNFKNQGELFFTQGVWLVIPVIPTLGRRRQEYQEFKAILGCTVS